MSNPSTIGPVGLEPAAGLLEQFQDRVVTGFLSGIFTQLRDKSIVRRGDVASWLACQEGCSEPALLGPHLYDGLCGVALFLGAYHAATRNDQAFKLALQSVEHLRAKIASLSAMPAEQRPAGLAIGGLVGLGGFLYTFIRLAAWLGVPELMETASQAASLITADRILRDDTLDFVGGCAGTLLALLLFERACSQGRERAMDLALLCGKHLLDSRTAYQSGPRAWPGRDRPPLSGFAHGASGIAYALVKLFERTGQAQFLEAALEGFAFERRLYIPHAKTWLDLRFNRPHEQAAWCYGAPGIMLARAGSVFFTTDPAIREDLEIALAITLTLPECSIDHLCCGNFGRIEVLHTAGQILNRPQIIGIAQEQEQCRLIEAGEKKLRFVGSEVHDIASFQPGLFRGISGVGYTLLRLAFPSRFPSILMLE